jgi:hypothetical protein
LSNTGTGVCITSGFDKVTIFTFSPQQGIAERHHSQAISQYYSKFDGGKLRVDNRRKRCSLIQDWSTECG